MKAKLQLNHIIAFVAILCFSLNNFSVKAQSTIAFNATPPTAGNAGESITANLLYKLNVGTDLSKPGGTISLQLNLVDPSVLDTWGNPNETEMPGRVNIETIAAASSESPYQMTATLGSGATLPSASLTGGKYYVLRASIFEHNTGNDWDWKDSKSTPIIINAGTIVTYSNAFASTVIQTKSEGKTITETVEYTTPDVSKIMFKLQRLTDWPSAWQETDIPGTTVTFDNLAATGSGITATQSATITIPAGTLANYSLGTDQTYKIVAVLTDMAGNHWTDARKTVVISSVLGTSSFEKQNAKLVAQNPVKGTLVVNNDLDFKSISIYDLSGKAILQVNKENSIDGIDVSNLNNGLYLIATDNNLQTKFIKE